MNTSDTLNLKMRLKVKDFYFYFLGTSLFTAQLRYLNGIRGTVFCMRNRSSSITLQLVPHIFIA